jgi:hypothetical protein
MPRTKGAKNKTPYEWKRLDIPEKGFTWVRVKDMWVKEVKLAQLIFRPNLVKTGFYNDDA